MWYLTNGRVIGKGRLFWLNYKLVKIARNLKTRNLANNLVHIPCIVEHNIRMAWIKSKEIRAVWGGQAVLCLHRNRSEKWKKGEKEAN